MRSRNIKPSFFKNEALSECSMGARLAFIGLWCLADKNGLLENRPKRINAELFPYEPSPLLNGYLTELARLGFIEYKKGEGMSYIFIPKFSEHQHPHNTETTKLPDPKSLENIDNQKNNGEVTVAQPLDNVSCPADSLLLNPDSLLLNPSLLHGKNLLSDIEAVANAPINFVDGDRKVEVSNLEQIIDYDNNLYAKKKKPKKDNIISPAGFDEWWALYPKKQDKGTARKAYIKACKLVSVEELLAGLNRSVAKWNTENTEGGKWIPQPAKWLNGERWDDDFSDFKPSPKKIDDVDQQMTAYANQIKKERGWI